MRSPFDSTIAFARCDAASPADLHPEERPCLSPRAVEKRVAEFSAGRAAAAACLAQLQYPPTPVLRGADRAPVWPAGLVGTITHSGGIALAAVAQAAQWHGIGLDLEHVSGVRRIEIADRIADADEKVWIGTDRARLAAVFSAKEAIFKAIYPIHRRWFGFAAVTLRPTDAGFDAVLREHLDRPRGSVVPVGVRWLDGAVLTWVSLARPAAGPSPCGPSSPASA